MKNRYIMLIFTMFWFAICIGIGIFCVIIFDVLIKIIEIKVLKFLYRILINL